MRKTIFLLIFICMCQVVLLSRTDSIHDLKKAVVQIGRLGFKTELPVRYINRKQLEQYILRVFDQDYPDEVAEKDAFFLYTMGFVDKKMNIKKIRKRILINNVGGLYNERTKELIALEEYRDINTINSLIIIHELRHSIQDQYYNLSEILGDYSDFDDRRLAVLSAVEGDATFVMVQYSGFSPEVLTSYNADALMSFSPLPNTGILYHYPEIIKQQLTMPYISGLKFINSVFKKKKWKGVNQILKSPPVSSEQILHPEKYLKKETPMKVQIGYVPGGYEFYHSGVIGEFYLNILLKGEGEYQDFAAGWGGDLYKIYSRPTSYFLIWESSWDREKMASRFLVGFQRFVERRFYLNFKEGNVKGSPFIAGISKYGYFFIRRFKNRIFYIRTNDRNAMNIFIKGGYYD
ncbi:MAG: hypothetical protein KAT17_08830 [Candidatus Aminicenantes bacterium]|nr:hypothetical protein [Candidatus Aminicenantes bacterium]